MVRFLPNLAGFLLAAPVAVYQGWQLQEFCWSVWIAALVLTWVSVLSASIRMLGRAGPSRQSLLNHFPGVSQVPQTVFSLIFTVAVFGFATLACQLVAFIFGFYGLFLSFFAEMEPHVFFGRNGFINSDFYGPVLYLLESYWPLVVAVLIANANTVFSSCSRGDALNQISAPVLRIHVFVVLQPFLAILFWLIFGENYHTPAVLALMALLHWPQGKRPTPVSAETRGC